MPETLVFPLAAFSLEAVKKAAYRFSDVMSVDIRSSPDRIECIIHFDKHQSASEEQQVLAAFRNEVLDQDLRASISKETEPMRNAILAYAFSKTGLQSGGE
jgi:His-Xaa-Ser system protein HxsD